MGHTQSSHFWSNYDPIYSLNMDEIEKNKYFIR